MLGAIIGDVVGSVYEFHNTKDYDFPIFTPDSNYTDDSIMTMAVAHWGMSDPDFTHEKLEESLVGFARRFPAPMGGYGGTFRKWLFNPETLTDYGTDKVVMKRCPYNSWGNGSAMRVSAVGWLFDTLEETERVAGISAAITHNHPEGIKGAQAVAAAVYLARTGSSKEAIAAYITRKYGYRLNVAWEELHAAYGWDASCQGTVPPALVAFLESSDFESAIRRAVSLGGDSDTLACITGAVAEAYYRQIPPYMLSFVMKRLPEEFRRLLAKLSEGFYGQCYANYVFPNTETSGRRFTPQNITELNPGEIFVFGSNLAGFHGGGAARTAHHRFGAEWGVGVGMTGQCYAIPTMQGGVDTIRPYVDDFIGYASRHPEYTFYVTKIGCGIAGFREEEIAPLFSEAVGLCNVVLPESFYRILTETGEL